MYTDPELDVDRSLNEHKAQQLLIANEKPRGIRNTGPSHGGKSLNEERQLLEKRLFIRTTNVTSTASSTDRYSFAMSTSEESCCLENEDESMKYIQCYEKMDQYFVETYAYKEAEEIFNKHGIIILTGPPGCGKTIAAAHLILKQLHHASDLTFRKVNSFEELSFVDKDTKTLLLIDNLFFQKTIELHLVHWWDELKRIHEQYFEKKETKSEIHRIRIIITARTNAIKRACTYMEKVTPILNDKFIKDMGALSKEEKNRIFLKQIEFAKQEREVEIKSTGEEITWGIGDSDGPIGFPLCAHLYVCCEEYRKSGIHFFSRPIKYLKVQIKDEIERDKSNKTKSLFFVLFFREWQIKSGNFNNFEIKNERHCQLVLASVSTDLLNHFGPFDFEALDSEAERLTGAFLKEVSDHTYTFFHDSVFEAVGTYFCETYGRETAKYFPLDIIQNQKYENLTEKQQSTLITRLYYETCNQRLNQVFACRVWEKANFVNCFCAELKEKDENSIVTFFTLSNESTHVKLPTMFWSSYNNLTYLTELFYDIVNTQNINLDYQLYVSYYGKCCARNVGLLKTSNEMLKDNLSLIKDRVLNFRDSEGNCILHILITSESSDRYVAFGVEKLAKDGLLIDAKNNNRVTPLMFAVEQTISRTEAIKTLLRFSPKLRYKSTFNSTVFHHCLGSRNDDEMCAKYLNILLKEKDAAHWLSRDDFNGDTALGIAAKETKRSRILSILELLQSNVDIINSVNEDGYSPLHLSVRSLKGDCKYMKIECCVRVVILIVYGADPCKQSDRNATAIDECAYDCVKNILRNPKDYENMRHELFILLDELKWTDAIKNSEAFLISSKFLNIAALRTPINIVACHLKNTFF